MFCPPNETIAQLTEKTKLLAQKCKKRPTMDQSNAMSSKPVARQQVATFKSYISETENGGAETVDSSEASQSPLQCLNVNLSSLNRLIKNRCSLTASYTCSTFPRRKKPKKATAKWFIKVSL